MNRKEAISIIAKEIGNNLIISANGFISRDLYETCDRNENFYMIGSMGLASSIGLGVALKNPKIKVFIFDGDGNILMNLGSLTTIGSLQPRNFIHIIFDNNSHESTGGQPTHSNKIKLSGIGKSVNYKVFNIDSKKDLISNLKKITNYKGPIMFVVKVKKSTKVSIRVEIEPKKIVERFSKSLEIFSP
jgi:thiamine pyrophosphate-dependent acetolactate synthase large subunit-like protein